MYFLLMKSHRARALLPLLVITLAACSRSGRHADPAPRADPDLITAEEIAQTTATTLLDAVRALRPAWMLRSRPTAVMQQQQAQLIVYVDGTRFGNMESLRQLMPSAVVFVRYFSPGAAQARFGPGHLLGAIEVTTLRR